MLVYARTTRKTPNSKIARGLDQLIDLRLGWGAESFRSSYEARLVDAKSSRPNSTGGSAPKRAPVNSNEGNVECGVGEICAGLATGDTLGFTTFRSSFQRLSSGVPDSWNNFTTNSQSVLGLALIVFTFPDGVVISTHWSFETADLVRPVNVIMIAISFTLKALTAKVRNEPGWRVRLLNPQV